MNNRQVKVSMLRRQARAVPVRRDSWAPEIAGLLLLAIAVLASAGIIG